MASPGTARFDINRTPRERSQRAQLALRNLWLKLQSLASPQRL